ncbi:unnamed protein product [Lactuca virosa]|uniref:Uncharacterized protein n=1 Tax=Lactuca virosa TaxID=75947 RepID=A0AAU9LFH3_9ASTR|nr:unnamed protein product [Lactuca virosa]
MRVYGGNFSAKGETEFNEPSVVHGASRCSDIALARKDINIVWYLLFNSPMTYCVNLTNLLNLDHVLGNSKGAVAVAVLILIFKNPVSVTFFSWILADGEEHGGRRVLYLRLVVDKGVALESLNPPKVAENPDWNQHLMFSETGNNRTASVELISMILFTVAIGLMWVMGAAALQKYIGGLGGIGLCFLQMFKKLYWFRWN